MYKHSPNAIVLWYLEAEREMTCDGNVQMGDWPPLYLKYVGLGHG